MVYNLLQGSIKVLIKRAVCLQGHTMLPHPHQHILQAYDVCGCCSLGHGACIPAEDDQLHAILQVWVRYTAAVQHTKVDDMVWAGQ